MPQRSRLRETRYVEPKRKSPKWINGLFRALRSPAAAPQPARKPAVVGRKKAPPTPPLFSIHLSLDRKLDILGVFLAVLGLITFLSMFSGRPESLTGAWMNLLRGIFGLGAYLLPLGLVALGFWLFLRSVDTLPRLDPERITGIVLVFGNLTAWLHFTQNLLRVTLNGGDFIEPVDIALSYETISGAGGYLGGIICHVLLFGLGVWGTAVVLLAWFVIGLMMSFDVSVPELFGWLPVFFGAIRRRLLRIFSKRPVQPYRYEQPLPIQEIPPLQSPLQARPEPTFARDQSLQVPSPAAADQKTWHIPSPAQILDGVRPAIQDDLGEADRTSIIEETLTSFGAPAHVVEIHRGPTITLFGVEPDFIETRRGRMRVRVAKIAALADDLALALAAKRVRIQAPVPGRGYVGIEVPNEQTALVSLLSIVESPAFQRVKSSLRIALGQNVSGDAVAADLAVMPHLLIAGATGSGKSVCVNSIITCLLLHNTPETLRFLMVDPKRVELTGYNGIPHLLAPVVVELKQVVGALQWVTREMDRRYQAFSDLGVRHIAEYNHAVLTASPTKPVSPTAAPLPHQNIFPYLVVIIDELADLMMLAPDETERSITRLAQLARATGIHLIIATQRPSVDVVTGVIKANFPARVAFAVASGVDSRVILDQPGAERLLGSGDMLFQAPDAPAPVRLQGVFASDGEIQRLTGHWRGLAVQTTQVGAPSTAPAPDVIPPGVPLKQLTFLEETQEDEGDPLLEDAIKLVRRQGRASVSMLQRKMRIGYTRAARLVEAMEARQVIGPPDHDTGVRPILDIDPPAAPDDAG